MIRLMVLLLAASAQAQDMDWSTPLDLGEPIDWSTPIKSVPSTQVTYPYGDIIVTDIVDEDGNRETLTTYRIGEATITQGESIECVTYGNVTTCK